MAKNKTYAEQAKAIMNKYKLRLGEKFDKGDSLAVAAMNAELQALQQEQEQAKQVAEQAEQVEQQETIKQFRDGGKLTKKQQSSLSRILEALPQGAQQREGVFQNPAGDTVYANVGQQGNPQFIDNPVGAFRNPQGMIDQSRQSNIQEGLVNPAPVQIPLRQGYNTGPAPEPGSQYIPQFQTGGNLFQQGFANTQATGNYRDVFNQNMLQNPYQAGAAPTSLGAYQAAQSGGMNLSNQQGMGLNMNQAGGGQTFMNNFMNNTPTGNSGTYAPAGGDGGSFMSRVPIGSVISGIGDIVANSIPIKMPKYDYQEYKPTKAQANLVDYRREREQVGRERDIANAQIARGAKARGSQAGLMESILAGQTATQRTAGQQFGQSLEREGNVNAQIKNQIQAQNQQKEMAAFQINTRNKQFANQLERIDAMDSNIQKQNIAKAGFGTVGQYLNDRGAATNYDTQVNMEMARNPNYSLQQADPTFWRRFAGITDPADVTYKNTNDKSNTYG